MEKKTGQWWLNSAGDTGLIPGSGRSPGGGEGNSLWYSCLESPMDRGAWWATVHGVTKELDTAEHPWRRNRNPRYIPLKSPSQMK